MNHSILKKVSSNKLQKIRRHLARLYGVDQTDSLLERLYQTIGRYGMSQQVTQRDRN